MTSDRAPSSGPVAIVGAGSWGTALAIHLGRRGAVARLWARDADLAREIVRRGENPRYLPGVAIPARVTATGDAAIALATTVVAAIIIVRHRANIQRLRAGTESRLGQRARVA